MNVTRIPWLTPALSLFAQQLQQGRMPHGVLLPLPLADGGLMLAQFMASLALCLSPHGAEPCGRCRSCLLFAAGNHPDYQCVQADGQQIKVEQVRTLTQSMTATAQQGGRRVAVFAECDRMNIAAANALLKTLEEPGEGILLILQTDRPGVLLPTIVSRCQQLPLTPPKSAQLQQWLGLASAAEMAEVSWYLPISGGAMALAEYLSSGYLEELKKLRQAWQQSLNSGHLSPKLTSLSEEQLFDALKLLHRLWRDEMAAGQLDALQQLQLAALAARLMTDWQQFRQMANVNYLALFQSYVLEYKKLKN